MWCAMSILALWEVLWGCLFAPKGGLAWREYVCGKTEVDGRNQAPYRSGHINRFAWALRPIPRHFGGANCIPKYGGVVW